MEVPEDILEVKRTHGPECAGCDEALKNAILRLYADGVWRRPGMYVDGEGRFHRALVERRVRAARLPEGDEKIPVRRVVTDGEVQRAEEVLRRHFEKDGYVGRWDILARQVLEAAARTEEQVEPEEDLGCPDALPGEVASIHAEDARKAAR